MDGKELKLERIRHELSQKDMADVIGKSVYSYAKKEQGASSCSEEEMVKITRKFGLDFHRFNQIFFSGELPNW